MRTNQDLYEETKLLSLLAQGHEYAFQLIYDRHKVRLYNVAMRYLKSPTLAQEVVQDVFMKLWQERRNINPDLPVEGWLFTVTKNNVLNRLKRLANEWKALDYIKDTQQFEDDSLQEQIADNDLRKLLKQALACLSEKQLQVYTLAREENLSYLQIAEHLDISALTVKTHMSRALRSIKVYLTGHLDVLAPVIFLSLLS